jgi:disulfide bond formation protein DsbB
MRKTDDPCPFPLRAALALAGLAAAVALGVAFAAEWWGGLVPCALCLLERWPYRVAIALAVVGLLLPRPLARAALALILLVVLAEIASAAVHVGVEFHWWPSPLPQCAAPPVIMGGSIAERLRNMPERPTKSCEEGVYPIPGVPISFAQANFLYALAFSAGVATLLSATGRRRA